MSKFERENMLLLICPTPSYSSCHFLRYEAVSLSLCFSLPLSTVQGQGVRLLIAQKKINTNTGRLAKGK